MNLESHKMAFPVAIKLKTKARTSGHRGANRVLGLWVERDLVGYICHFL